jgi:glycerophosphoryl diester phosphodiesterase
VLVVHHDETVDGTTDATGPVVERTLAELQALDAAHWW